ncbi:MAG: histidine kinase N-terminal 7TM domain-containing protein [Bacteroidota bacterium]
MNIDWKFNYIAPIHIITALICLIIALFVYRKKDTNGRISFMLMMLFAAEWALSLAFEASAPTMYLKILFSKFEYIGNMFVAVSFLYFTVAFTNRTSVFIKRFISLFVIIPFITLLLAFTNDYHHLLWSGFEWSPDKNNILIYYHGVWFWVATFYAFLLMILGDIILIASFINYPANYKRQIWYLIIGGIFPFITTLLYAIRLSPLIGLDISAIGFIFTGIFIFIGLTREQFLDLVPVARHLLIEKMSDVVLTLDNSERIVDINPAGKLVLKFDNNITGTKITEALPILKSFISEKIKVIEKREEVFIDKPISKWFDVMITPLMDKKSNYTGSLLVLRDITAKKENEDKLHNLNIQLKESEQKLQDLNNQKDKLFSVIAHDLLNPFHVMIGYSEILALDIDKLDFNEVKEITKHISDAAELGNEILVNLLEWSRSQSNSLQMSMENINLNVLLTNIISQVANLSKHKDINIEYINIADDNVVADKNIIVTVIRNLLTNAIKFSNKGSKIELIAQSNKQNFTISVKDYGIGIPKDDINKIFRLDKKYTTTGTEGEQGTGLGLILCKDFVEKHGGTLNIDSTEGVGSIFTISIPQ